MTDAGLDIRDAFFDELYDIAAADSDVLFLTADMGAFSLERFKKNLNRQYINVGVAEQNMISVATGLTLGGKKVFVYAVAPFVTMRCYEQIKVNISGMCLPITIIGAGPGITYNSDGPTHHAVQDIAIMRALPGMVILNPSDPVMASRMARISYESESPVYVRIDKGRLPILYPQEYDFSGGLSLLKEGQDLLIIATGLMVHNALRVAEELKNYSIDAAVMDLYRIKPLNEHLLLHYADQFNRIVTLEEHSIIGGIGSAVSEVLFDHGRMVSVKRCAIEDGYCEKYGDREWMHKFYHIDIQNVQSEIVTWCKKEAAERLSLAHNVNPSNDNDKKELRAENFAEIFGINLEDLPHECKKIVNECNFGYRHPTNIERDEIILNILKKINSPDLVISGKERQNQWEEGWSENLKDFIEGNYDLDTLIPKYYRPNHFMRLNKEYILSEDDKFEYNFFRVLRKWIYIKYLQKAHAIFEFCCGSGHNLPILAELYPEKKIYGLDWVQASVDIVDSMANKYGWNMKGYLFDMFSPNLNLNINDNDAFITFGGLEQLGERYTSFINFVLMKNPSICINVEPLFELYDDNVLVDYLALLFHKRRGYLGNYLSYLKLLEKQNRIEIMSIRKIDFGGMYHDGWSIAIWRPFR